MADLPCVKYLVFMIGSEMNGNQILKGLPEDERHLLLPSLEVEMLHLGDVIQREEESIQCVYFPLSAGISLTNHVDNQHIVDVTVVGKEGCSGASVVLGTDISPSTAMIEIEGVAVRLPVSSITDQRFHLPYLVGAMIHYNALLMRHAVVAVGCSQFHSSSQRLARWLKAHWHRTGIESFPFTTAFLAAQAGIAATTAEKVLDDLELHGIVKLSHNSVTITNQEALTQRACPCFSKATEATEDYLRNLANFTQRCSVANP